MTDHSKIFSSKDVQDHSRLLSVLLENNHELIVLLDQNGKIVYQSSSAAGGAQWFGEELLPAYFNQLPFHPQDKEMILSSFEDACKNPLKVIPVRFRIVHKKGNYIHVDGSIKNLLDDEKINAIVLHIRDVSNRVSREEVMQFYIESCPVAVAMFNTEMQYIVASKKWLSDYRLSEQTIAGMSHVDLFPEIKEKWKSVYRQCLSGNSVENKEYRLERADGTVQWLRWEVKPWWNSFGQVGGLIIFSEDITERKKAAEALSSSEAKFRSLIERISDAFISLDTEWRFTYVNPVAEKLLARKADQLIGRNIWEVFPKAVNGPFYKAFHQGMVTLENVYIQDFSEPLNYAVSVRAYPSLTGMSIYFRDIREEYNAKKTIRESEERFRRLVERISDAFIALDKDWCYVYSNKRAEEMFGKSNDDLVGKNIWDVFPNAVNGPFYKAYNQAMTTQQHVSFINYSPYGKRWLEVNVYPSETGLTVYFKDINERIEAENAAKKSESVRQAIMKSALDAIICIDIKNKILFWNPQAEQLFGWKAEEVMGLQLEQTIIPPVYHARHKAGHKHFVETGESTIMNKVVEVSARTKEGYEFPIELFIVKIEEDKELFFCAFIRDITDRKVKEQNLMQINRRLKLTQEIAHIGGVEIDFEQNLLICSSETLSIYGIDESKRQVTVEEWFSYIHPEDVEHVKEITFKFIKDEQDVIFYHRIIRPDGEIRYIRAFTRSEYNSVTKQKLVFGVVHDITEIKRLENELLTLKEIEQRNITAAIIKAQEKERNAIGEELHDNINQILTAVSLHLARLRFNKTQTDEIADLSINYISMAIEENRKIARELVVPDFVTDSLQNRIEKLARLMLGSKNIQVIFDFKLFEKKYLNSDQNLTIYRIMQEQCTNILKYANATRVNISFSSENDLLTMLIADNGAGMNKNKIPDGIGLRNIKSRLSLLNGTVAIKSEPGKGFTLIVQFPIIKSIDRI